MFAALQVPGLLKDQLRAAELVRSDQLKCGVVFTVRIVGTGWFKIAQQLEQLVGLKRQT